MALADWEVIMGGGLVLNTQYRVSGNKSLSQEFDKGATHIVHMNTYNDAPKNVEVRTWMSVLQSDVGVYEYLIGAISRKQQGADTYFYWCLFIDVNADGSIDAVKAQAGYYLQGGQYATVDTDITDTYKSQINDYWYEGKWRFVKMVGYESAGKYHVTIEMTTDIDTPDVNNPPIDMLVGIFSADIDIPEELQNGGACGLVVGGTDISQNNTMGAPLYDYTQLYY